MKRVRFFAFFAFAFLALAPGAEAQRTKKPAPRPTPRATPRPVVSAEVAAAKQKVSIQLHNVNVFIDRMGPIAVFIENSDKDAAARRLKPDQVAANEKNKKNVIASIAALRQVLVSLETEFRTKPSLAQYLPRIQGIATLCAQSEDSAIAGKFVASKDPLRQVALKLNETLAVLPGPVSSSTSPQASAMPVSNSATNRPVPTQPASGTNREPAVGMTIAQVLQSSWGAPANKRTSNTTNGTTEVWSYSGNRTIYFFNGKVSNIVR